MNISKISHQLKKESEMYPMSETPSAILMKSIIVSMAEYYQRELTAKIERSINMKEQQTAGQLLESIVASIDEFFEGEIRAQESEIDEK